MPSLETGDGASRLYLEQVFPLLMVEQQRGWGGIQAQTPVFSGAVDIRRRALEFLLDLHAGQVEAERIRLRREESQLGARWSQAVATFEALLTDEGVVVDHLQTTLADTWPPDPGPRLRAATADGGWEDVDDILVRLRQQYRALLLPVGAPESRAGEAELENLLRELDAARLASSGLREQLVLDQRELNLLGQRQEVLRRDRREHADIVKLRRFGSSALASLHRDCPICHRTLENISLAPGAIEAIMSPEDTLAYLDQQLELVEAMVADGDRTLAAVREQLIAVESSANHTRRRLRGLRRDLAGADGPASADRIEQRVRTADRIERLERHGNRLEDLDQTLRGLAPEAARVRAALKSLPRGKQLTDADEAKLASLEGTFLRQLRAYGFGSFHEDRLLISRADYLPKREEFDLQADISASDSVRVIWAYLIGLFDASRDHATNHPRWLLFDEPRQQSAKEVSFQALLHQAARAAGEDTQIIFITSEDKQRLDAMLDGVDAHRINVDGYLLRLLDDAEAMP